MSLFTPYAPAHMHDSPFVLGRRHDSPFAVRGGDFACQAKSRRQAWMRETEGTRLDRPPVRVRLAGETTLPRTEASPYTP
jgi:hypothetical protein